MATDVYLDTARLGLIAPTAKSESEAYMRLAETESASAFFEEMLFSTADPSGQCKSFQVWKGLDDLKQRLKGFVGLPNDANVLLAGRTKTFARIAARLLFGHCESLLITDLGWPDYVNLLQSYAERLQRRIVRVDLSHAVLRDRATPSEILDMIVNAYRNGGCDGLFLTAISNTGVALDVPSIIGRLETLFDLPFVAVDGAQHLAHLPADLTELCDFYFAGTHKWFGGHLPLAVAFHARRRSKSRITATVKRLLAREEIDDPLLQMLETSPANNQAFGETVNVAPLFAASGAVFDAKQDEAASIQIQSGNVNILADVSRGAGWKPLQPRDDFRSGILLAESHQFRRTPPEILRNRLQKHGIAATAFENGIIRLSAPKVPMTGQQVDTVSAALRLL